MNLWIIDLIFQWEGDFFCHKCPYHISSSVVNILLHHLLKCLLEIPNLPLPHLFHFFALSNIILFCLPHLFWSWFKDHFMYLKGEDIPRQVGGISSSVLLHSTLIFTFLYYKAVVLNMKSEKTYVNKIFELCLIFRKSNRSTQSTAEWVSLYLDMI